MDVLLQVGKDGELQISSVDLACVQTSPLPQKKIGRRDLCESPSLIMFPLHLHKLLFLCFFFLCQLKRC